MKKILSLALVFILVLTTLASCNFNKKDEETTTTAAPDTNQTPAEKTYDIDSAVVYLESLYKDAFKANPKTAIDYEVVSQVMIGGLTYTVAWSVNTDKVTVGEAKDGKVIINVDEKSPEEVKYDLTATVTAGDNSATKTKVFKDLIVPVFGLMTWDEYIAAEKDALIPEVKGVVTGIVSKSVGASYNCLFLQDATGGAYYIYGMPDDADPIANLGIEIGMTVSVAGGIKDVYNGTHEIKPNNGALQVTIVSQEKTPVAPMDYTELFKKAADMKDPALVKYQSSLVTIKGVEITDQDLDKGYLKFTLAGKETYLRISSSTLAFPKADADAFKAEHAAKKGFTADVTGIISIYSGAFYLVPVSTDAFSYGAAVEKTPAEKVESALSGLKVLGSIYNKDTVIELPAADTTYADVTFTWASNNAAAVVADGKLTITVPEADTEIIITVTAKCGDAEDSKEFTVTLSNFPDANTFVDLEQANKMGILMGHNTYTEGKYFVTGTILSIDPDKNDATKLNSYGNMTIQDADGNTFYLYGLYSADGAVRFDKMEAQPKVGDTITVYGILGQYNDKAQMKNGWLVNAPAENTELSLVGANSIGLAQGHNVYTADKYIVTGEIVSIDPDKNDATKLNAYGNMTIKDADGNTFYLYGLYSADGSVRFDKMEAQPKVGDTITVIGIIGQYKGTAQMKNAWLYVAPEGGDNTDTPEIPATLAEQIAEAQKLANGDYLPYETTMTGTVVANSIVASTKVEGTWKLNLTDGTNTVAFYWVPVTGTPTDGCTITVTGKLTAYNGSVQFDDTATAKVEGGDNTDTPEEGGDNTDTPTTPDLSTTKGIYDAAALLENNVNLAGGPYTMTGEIVSVDTAYSAEHGNVTVSIVVDGYTFKCYRLAGTGADVIAVGDTITVTGEITAYYSAPQFAQGSTLVSYEKAPEEDEVVDGTKVTVTIGDYATANNWADATKYLTITMDENITVTAAGGDNTGKFYNNGKNWRIYQKETPAVTITAANGKTIKSVKITYASQNNGVLTMNGNNVANAAVVEVNAASVTFSVGNTSTADNGQARISAIEVIYA